MQRTIWEWLGIEKTTDKSQIRKAYAEQVKRYHPEEFPQEAQELRKAYKSAMALASDTRIAPGWAEDNDNIAQGISFAVRDSGRVLPEFSHFESQAESDAGTKPKYDCPKPVPPGGQSGPEYAYQKPVPPGGQSVPEPEAESDHMYYDPGEGLFMVALYDASTGKYNFYGSVDKYLEENLDMDSIKGLDYFTKGGKSLR